MPYIPQEDRPQYDALVDELAEKLRSLGSNDAMVGPLNYIVSRLTWQLCGRGGGECRYARLNAVVGALDCAKGELKRRIVDPYEDIKIGEAGDVEIRPKD